MSLLRVERKFLHAPIQKLANEQLIFARAIHFLDPAELLHLLAGGAEFAQDMSFQIELVHGTHGVRAVKILLWPRRDADRPGSADARPNGAQHQVVVKHLNPAVSPIAHINVALPVRPHRWGSADLSRSPPLPSTP